MTRSIDLVREFHAAFGQDDADLPRIDNEAINELRIRLLDEELEELCAALRARDPIATLDALTDLQYVLDGAYLQLGFAAMKDAALAEVHRSNMTKLGADGRPVRRVDGKITKGPNYSPPNLAPIIELAAMSPVPPLCQHGPEVACSMCAPEMPSVPCPNCVPPWNACRIHPSQPTAPSLAIPPQAIAEEVGPAGGESGVFLHAADCDSWSGEGCSREPGCGEGSR